MDKIEERKIYAQTSSGLGRGVSGGCFWQRMPWPHEKGNVDDVWHGRDILFFMFFTRRMISLDYLLAALPMAVGQWGGDRNTAYGHALEEDWQGPGRGGPDEGPNRDERLCGQDGQEGLKEGEGSTIIVPVCMSIDACAEY